MEFLVILLVVGATFGLCWLLDRGFTRLFRSRKQHKSGMAVRLNRHYGGFGLVMAVIGVAGIFSGLTAGTVMLVGGILVFLLGAALVTYYLTYGIYYDEDSFLVAAFGKKSVSHQYREIQSQQVYLLQGGHIMVELHLENGDSVQVQLRMQGAEAFLDKAYSGWCGQKGIDPQTCEFHNPQNSCWFPPVEG